MAEYIELGSAIARIREEGIYGEGHSDEERENDVISMLESIPAADVAPVVHGRWINVRGEDSGMNWKCSNCSRRVMPKYPYCPNCGAKMDLEVRE